MTTLLYTAVAAMFTAVLALAVMFAAPSAAVAQAALAVVVAATLISYVCMRVDLVLWRREHVRLGLKRTATEARNNNYSKHS
jgi:hypothetical protein